MATGRISRLVNLVSNMGWRYVGFRLGREFASRTGFLKNKFPVNPAPKKYLSLADWKAQNVHFLFQSRETLTIPKNPDASLRERYENIKEGKFLFFNSTLIDLGSNYDWVTNPDSGFKYDIHKHWTQIADFSAEAGDIKYVWEKSRFSYLNDVIRYDYHFGHDCSQFVFSEILSWIKHNPVNCGPNYRCSQEMSLRLLNWTFALHYYRNAHALTEAVFFEIQNAIYWQLQHIRHNINFSRIAVRNNHAITETLCLYLCGLLYPTLPGARDLKSLGKKWFEEEIAYQIHEDGTFLQYSMNYHRVVVQLLTWAISLSEKNNEKFSPVVYDRARKSLIFLRTCMVDENGWLPNYGHNDGALFFRFNNAHFRDYRPQLAALGAALGMKIFGDEDFEETAWYGLSSGTEVWKPTLGIHQFTSGGYYVIRELETLTFIRCGSHRDRPHQADNLHIDIWYRGENLLIDAGSYKYNTDEKTIRYFSGTQSHNSVMVNDHDQMLKGIRFIWYYWTKCLSASLRENDKTFEFSGSIQAFHHIKNGIVHKRTVVKTKDKPEWHIHDEVLGAPAGAVIKQLWHLFPANSTCVNIAAKDANNNDLTVNQADGWYSGLYGVKEKSAEYYFCTTENMIHTTISLNK